MGIVDVAIITTLTMYFLLTIAYHLDRTDWVLNHLDYFAMIPKWNFFAPKPGMHNFYLLYRDEYADGELGRWQVLFDCEDYRSRWTGIWNPQKRTRKALFDLMSTLVSEDDSTEENKMLIRLSIPYLLIINLVSSLPKKKDAVASQFLVMENYANEPSYSVFTSDLHEL